MDIGTAILFFAIGFIVGKFWKYIMMAITDFKKEQDQLRQRPQPPRIN